MHMEHIECPHCKAEIEVDVEMYIDCGDVCYDIAISEKEAVEAGVEPMEYKCVSCENNFRLELDENFWGNEDIPIFVRPL